jgi:hypothetical protein
MLRSLFQGCCILPSNLTFNETMFECFDEVKQFFPEEGRFWRKCLAATLQILLTVSPQMSHKRLFVPFVTQISL